MQLSKDNGGRSVCLGVAFGTLFHEFASLPHVVTIAVNPVSL